VTSDAGLLAYRELDDVLGLTEMAGDVLADARSGKNGRHALAGLFRQSVFGRLAGYEDVNDADRLRHDPAMRWIVRGKAAQRSAASPSQMGRFETQWLAAPENFAALADLSGQWIDLVHGRRLSRGIVLDMDSSVSPTHGEQEMSVWNGHYACTCYHPLFVFNQFGDLERCALRASISERTRPLPEVYEFLEAERDVRAMDQGGQRRDQVDAIVVPNVRRQRGAAPASCARLQPRQFPAHAGDVGADQGLVADDLEGQADQDRRENGEPRPLCHLPDGRVVIARQMFQEILRLIAELRPQPPPAPA
jgi:hypothetical protein